jgi:hypothetical protein
MKANTALAVVYPASKRGDTAAGPDGFRGSTAGQMDELGSSSHRSLTFVEPGPTGSPSSFVTFAGQRLGSGVDRVTLPAERRRAGDKIHHGSTLPKARAPSVCHSSGHDVHRTSSQALGYPLLWSNVFTKRGANDGSGAMDEHCSKIPVAALADPSDVFLARLLGCAASTRAKPRSDVLI